MRGVEEKTSEGLGEKKGNVCWDADEGERRKRGGEREGRQVREGKMETGKKIKKKKEEVGEVEKLVTEREIEVGRE